MSDDEITRYARAAGQGDREAVTDFVRATQADVWRYVAYIAGTQYADDLTQETYLRAIGALPSFRGDTAALVWLLSIARRTAMDHFRRMHRMPTAARFVSVAEADSQPEARRHPDPAGELALRALVERLEPNRRLVFVLTQMLGFSYAEAAKVCGVPIGTVRSRLARAREDLGGWVTATEVEHPDFGADMLPPVGEPDAASEQKKTLERRELRDRAPRHTDL